MRVVCSAHDLGPRPGTGLSPFDRSHGAGTHRSKAACVRRGRSNSPRPAPGDALLHGGCGRGTPSLRGLQPWLLPWTPPWDEGPERTAGGKRLVRSPSLVVVLVVAVGAWLQPGRAGLESGKSGRRLRTLRCVLSGRVTAAVSLRQGQLPVSPPMPRRDTEGARTSPLCPVSPAALSKKRPAPSSCVF